MFKKLLAASALTVVFSGSAFAQDSDGDGVIDVLDNCRVAANADQRNTDGDAFGNVCDADFNNDNQVNLFDLVQFKAAFGTGSPNEDLNGDGSINLFDLVRFKQLFGEPPGPGADIATYVVHVQPVLGAKCAPCHTGLGVGGHDVGTNYADSLQDADECPGLNVGQCALVRIQNGSMPQGAECTGDPSLDAGNAACLTADEQATMQAWLDAGQPE